MCHLVLSSCNTHNTEVIIGSVLVDMNIESGYSQQEPNSADVNEIIKKIEDTKNALKKYSCFDKSNVRVWATKNTDYNITCFFDVIQSHYRNLSFILSNINNRQVFTFVRICLFVNYSKCLSNFIIIFPVEVI